jgi:hypothetical protein
MRESIGFADIIAGGYEGAAEGNRVLEDLWQSGDRSWERYAG